MASPEVNMRRLLLASLLAATLAPSVAGACAGVFTPPDAVSTVTDHRIAIAISNEQTTLWDQVQYTGSPRDFVWILPTPTPAQIDIGSAEFFDWLETTTHPVVYPPPRTPSNLSGGGGGGVGCGGSASSSGPINGRDPPLPDDVTVFHEGHVGPYESATVGSSDPAALETWLTAHGYAVPPATRPIIASYVAQGWVFNVLRLRPDAAASQILPVRVTFPGHADTFPLRMVAAGAAQQIELLVWVIADQRYAASAATADASVAYDTVTLDDAQLRWSTVSSKSNYREVFLQTIADHGGRAFVTEYAQPWPSAVTAPAATASDFAVATVGQGARVTLTRLRTSIAPSLLSEDLRMMPSSNGQPVSNQHYLMSSQLTAAPTSEGLAGSRLPLVGLLGLFSLLRRRARDRKQAAREKV